MEGMAILFPIKCSCAIQHFEHFFIMTYKEQFAWLSANGFEDIEICSGNSILWRKKYEKFSLDLYWSQHIKRQWTLSIIGQGDDADILICEMPEHADFSTIDSVVFFFDSNCR